MRKQNRKGWCIWNRPPTLFWCFFKFYLTKFHFPVTSYYGLPKLKQKRESRLRNFTTEATRSSVIFRYRCYWFDTVNKIENTVWSRRCIVFHFWCIFRKWRLQHWQLLSLLKVKWSALHFWTQCAITEFFHW